MKIDPRIANRRLAVAEQQARARVRRSMVMLAVLAAGGGLAWFLLSPHMSVHDVVVHGAQRAAVDQILANGNVVPGRPIVAIRVGTIEEQLLADPWVESASVNVVFPSRVEINVHERTPIAWIWLDDRWGLLADDGMLLNYSENPVPIRSLIRIPVEDPGLGTPVDDEKVHGALQLIGAFPDNLARRSVAKVEGGELWMLVGYRLVRIGRPVDIEAKAVSVLAMINTAHDGVIDVTAPSRPALQVGMEYLTVEEESATGEEETDPLDL